MIWNISVWEMSYPSNMHRTVATSTGGFFCLPLRIIFPIYLASIYHDDIVTMFIGCTGPVRSGFDIGCCHAELILPATYFTPALYFSGFP